MINKKYRIIYLASTLAKTGPINVLYNLIKYLDKNKFDITVITLSPENDKNSRWNDFVDLGINLQSLNLSRLKGYLFGGLKLRRLVNKIKPDIIHSQCFRTNLFSAFFLDKYKSCSTVHCNYKVDFTSSYGKIIGMFIFVLHHLSLYLIKNNICCSEALAELLNKKYKYMNFSYVNNGIDTEFFKPAENKISLREELNLPTDKKIFIWVGSFIKLKNPIFLAKYIKEFDNNNFYIFCGDGPLLSECKQILKAQNNAIFTGNINNVIPYLQASDYYISTSSSEGLPMSVIEAQACGLFCILSDIPQHRFIARKEEALFETNKLINLYDIINQININEKYNNLSLTRFIASDMAKQYEAFYGSIH